MGLFSKIKQAFSKETNENAEKYIDGLTKTREEFVNKLSLLGIKYTKIDEKFYEELEEILIMADLGVQITMNFMERLRKRVKEENIEKIVHENERVKTLLEGKSIVKEIYVPNKIYEWIDNYTICWSKWSRKNNKYSKARFKNEE